MRVLVLPQDLVEEYAWLLLVDEVVRAITAFDEPARVSGIAEQVRASGLSVGAGLVKTALEDGLVPGAGEEPDAARPTPFTLEGRRYDLAWRVGGGSLDRSMRAYLECRVHMPTLDDLVHQTALAVQQGPIETKETIVRLLESRDAYFVHNGRIGLTSWLLDVSGEEEEDVILDNFFDEADDAEEVLRAAAEVTADNIVDAARAVIDLLGVGISLKMVQLAWWRIAGERFDAIESYAELLDSDRVYVAPDRVCYPSETLEDLRAALAATSSEIGDDVGDEADIEALLAEVEAAVQCVMRAPSSLAVESLAEEILEIQRDEPGFEVLAERLDEALKEQGAIAMCGRGRWIAPANRPEGKYEAVPEALVVRLVRVFTPQGGEVDVELEDAGLEDDLGVLVRDPMREDVCDEDEVAIDRRRVRRPEEVVWTVPRHHAQCGTMKIRQADGDFFGGLTGLAECVLRYPQGGATYSVWANFGLGLIYGLDDFYARFCPPSGAVLRLAPTALSGEYLLSFDGETDEDVFLTDEDLARLLAIGEEAAAKEMSVYDIMAQVLGAHPAGASFERIVTEVNVVRRTRRRLVASVLSLYHCFYQRGKSKDQWQYDARKAEQGRRKAKRKFMRKP